MSSGSRSGSSSTTCCGVSPFASRSNTSVTRIRIPLIQGRPPHCSGSMVMRVMWTSYFKVSKLALLNLLNRREPRDMDYHPLTVGTN
jgi:hypothetical protein